jgi:predicted Zn-ribbon and HTH transcriptional regulator
MTDELIRCLGCGFMACKSQYAKTQGYCPVCKSPVVQDHIDFFETHSKEMKQNAK